ncbi:endolytic transglycosylase MltG [Actinophytocola sp.]|uniref:endolytic transglycosylase MltG n=1 Tax=Actinophytocola sp. TaxID=1872138 RepID=UPI002ED533F1
MTYPEDDLDLFGEERTERHRPVRSSSGRRPAPRKKKRRTVVWIGMVVVLALIGVGGYYGYKQIVGIGDYDDFAGQGKGDVVVQVKDGDTTADVANTLVEAGVVASSRAFVVAAESNSAVRGVQPGYYVMKKESSGAAAVSKIVNPESQVGQFEVKPGSQLENITQPDESVVKGITGMLSDASCAELDGKSTCVPPEQLTQVVQTGDLAKLGVPEWAIPDASKAEPKRRLEGLIMPGVYDVKPGSTADELWTQVMTESATQMQALGLPTIADETGYTPYQVLTMASLVEKEAITKDFGKVARVTYNRLQEGMKLEYDSTINYVLDRPMIRTNREDRERVGAYNTYDNKGLPPTPISAPGEGALQAVVKPEEGGWLFFVKCQKDGTSCFATTNTEHNDNRALAQANGAY